MAPTCLSFSVFAPDIEEFRSYLEKCFDFEQVTVKKFRTWAERRQFNRDMKRKQAESERPILPANQKLITLSVQDAPTKKGVPTTPGGRQRNRVPSCPGSNLLCFRFSQSLSSTLTGSPKFASSMNICNVSLRSALFTTFLNVVSQSIPYSNMSGLATRI